LMISVMRSVTNFLTSANCGFLDDTLLSVLTCATSGASNWSSVSLSLSHESLLCWGFESRVIRLKHFTKIMRFENTWTVFWKNQVNL
jgi:hypothetical protein